MMGLQKISDGNGYTQLSEQNYAKRPARRPREAKNMNNYAENRCKGLYEPENAIFRPIFRISAPTARKTAIK